MAQIPCRQGHLAAGDVQEGDGTWHRFHLLNLSAELRNGSYLPDPVRRFPVNKEDGGQRIISAITLRDKVAQRAILTVIEPIGERIFHPDSFGYRPGRTIEMALARVREYILCGLRWVVDADIEQFFDRIPHKPLMRVLNKHIPDRELLALIRRWLRSGVMGRGYLSTPRGISQGAVLSPFLCNMYLTSLDQKMAGRNLPMVRFADDLLVFTRSRSDARKAHRYLEKTLKRMSLTLNPEKTQIARSGPRIRFLGKKLPKVKQGNLLNK